MSKTGEDTEIDVELARGRQVLLEKLSVILDPETANDFVYPKTNEIRQHLSLEELLLLQYNHPQERLMRLRSSEHYQTTTQSLSRPDLEASYQAFVREQVGQQHSRNELERYVRNSSDIDAAKRYLGMAKDMMTNPQQSHLLFRSSKLNEEKATLLKLSGYSNELQQLNDDPSVQKYFTPNLTNDTGRRDHHIHESDDTEFFYDKRKHPTQFMHLERGEKKYRITFLQDYDALKLLHHGSSHRSMNAATRTTRHGLRLTAKNVESLFDTDSSTVQDHSSASPTSNIHRETFPPLSLSALKEYRPSLTPKLPLLPKTPSTNTGIQRRKTMRKSDFVWQQSIVSSSKHE